MTTILHLGVPRITVILLVDKEFGSVRDVTTIHRTRRESIAASFQAFESLPKTDSIAVRIDNLEVAHAIRLISRLTAYRHIASTELGKQSIHIRELPRIRKKGQIPGRAGPGPAQQNRAASVHILRDHLRGIEEPAQTNTAWENRGNPEKQVNPGPWSGLAVLYWDVIEQTNKKLISERVTAAALSYPRGVLRCSRSRPRVLTKACCVRVCWEST